MRSLAVAALPTLLLLLMPSSASALADVAAVYVSTSDECTMTFVGHYVEWNHFQNAEQWQFVVKGTGTCDTKVAQPCDAVGSVQDGFTIWTNCYMRAETSPCWDWIWWGDVPWVVFNKIPPEFWSTCENVKLPASFSIGPATFVGPDQHRTASMTLVGVTQTGDVFVAA